MSSPTQDTWHVQPLGNIAEPRRGITYSSEMLESEVEGLPYINMKSFRKGGGFNPEGTKRYAGIYTHNDLIGESDLLVANTDVTAGDIVGAPALLPQELKTEKALYSHHVTRLRLSGDVTDTFLYYLLCLPEYRSHMLRIARGTTVLMLDMQAIKRIPIRAPKSDTEQRRIAEILSTLDEAIEQTEALIAKYQQIKAGLMHDLFTRGVTPDGRLRPPHYEAPQLYKASPLGRIPRDWKTTLLDDLALRGSGHTPNKNHPEYWNGGIKWISLADSWRLDRVYIADTDNHISEAGIANSSAVLHPPGVVVLSRDAGVGKSSITTESMAVSQHFMCWRCGPALNNYYLYYWLQYNKRQFENIATGSTIPTIGLTFFKRYMINVPTKIAEQERIGTTLLSTDRYIFGLEDDLKKNRVIKLGLMHDLLSGRVPVKVPEAIAA